MEVDQIQPFLEAMPHPKKLGLKVLEAEVARCVITMPITDHVRTFANGPIAQGALVTLLDSTLGTCAMITPEGWTPVVTLDLRVDNLRPSDADTPVMCLAEITHTTQEICFLRGEAWQEKGGQKHLLSMATATFISIDKKRVGGT